MEKFFVSRPIFAISLAIVIVLVGLISIMGLPIEQYPDITPPVVEVSATYDGADAETVNNAVATPVAQSVMGVSDMLYLQTTSANDGSMVMQVTFDIGSDPDLDAIFTQNNVSSTMIFGTEGSNRLFRFLLPSAAGEPGRDSFYDNMWRSSTELFYVMYKVGD